MKIETVDVTLLRESAASTPEAWGLAVADAMRALVRAVNAGRGCILRDRDAWLVAMGPSETAQLLADLTMTIARAPLGHAFLDAVLAGEQ